MRGEKKRKERNEEEERKRREEKGEEKARGEEGRRGEKRGLQVRYLHIDITLHASSLVHPPLLAAATGHPCGSTAGCGNARHVRV